VFSDNGVPEVTASDTTLTGGAPGIMAYGTSSAGDWAGGDAVGTESVGGTVSGLSGTVVLEDNGGDSLSVNAVGPFTFASLLPPGGSYDVTVETAPAGQYCTVTGGTGTVASTDITNVSVTCNTESAGSGNGTSASDGFARPDGTLGPNWTGFSEGGMVISSGMVVGGNPTNSGDMWAGQSFSSDQYSQITVTSAALTGNEWIGAVVRAQDGGQDLYLGMYYWNGGSPELMLFNRINGSWAQLGTYPCGTLAAGTRLELTVVGSSLAFSENGVPEVTASDTNLTGGSPGIMAYGTASAGNWTGGNAGFTVDYLGTDSTGVESFDVLSDNDGYGPQILRVLPPTHPAPGVAHNFLFVLPVEAGLGDVYGDGLKTLQALDAEDQYNVTIIEPSFDYQPWYANSSTNANQYETFMTRELVPWVMANLETTGTEKNWLIGFSKSGYGAQDLILKYPTLFALAASWDFPADMSSYDQYGVSPSENYGTEANFASNYQLTPAFVAAHAAPFEAQNRIWIGGYYYFGQDMTDYDALLTSEGIAHTNGLSQYLAHAWDSGWVPAALAGLYQDSLTYTVPGPTSQIVLSTGPAGAVAGSPFATQPVVTVEDGQGDTETGDSSAVTLSVVSGPGSLSGCTAPVSAVSGVATFSGCSIDTAGDYVLQATDGGFTTTADLTVTAPPTP
jgi:hypothetical protein